MKIEIYENYCALIIAILCRCIPEAAFEWLEVGEIKQIKLTDEDFEDILIMREYLTWTQIGEIYCIDYTSLAHRVDRYKVKINSR